MPKLSDFVMEFAAGLGVKHVFLVTGGGAMHLNESLSRRPEIEAVCNSHEQASAICAETYAKATDNIGVALVTTGPGGTNAVTGVAGAWLDSTPCLFLSGQVKRPDRMFDADGNPLGVRQLGVQEVDIVSIVKPITKYAVTILDPAEIRFHLEKAVHLARTGRPGPVWIDIPLDVQAAPIDFASLRGYVPDPPAAAAPEFAATVGGIAERLGLAPDARIVAPRAPYVWGMPLTWRWPALAIDPAEAPGVASGPLAAPFPDLVIASGRRAAPYLPAIKRASHGRTFTAFLKDPRASPRIADFLWVPEHDRLRGANVMATLLSPHRVTPEALAAARAAPRPEIARLPAPRVAVLLGGNSRDFAFSHADCRRFAGALRTLAESGVGLMATASRRTPADLADAVRACVEASDGWFWDGSGENPYLALLACADALVVTADSVNMTGEALATGKAIHLFRPEGGSRKIDHFLGRLSAMQVVRPFSGAFEACTYAPMDATPAIAIEIARRYRAFRTRTPP